MIGEARTRGRPRNDAPPPPAAFTPVVGQKVRRQSAGAAVLTVSRLLPSYARLVSANVDSPFWYIDIPINRFGGAGRSHYELVEDAPPAPAKEKP